MDILKQGNDILKQITETAFGQNEPETLADVKKLLESKYEIEKISGLKYCFNVHYYYSAKSS